MDSIESPPPVRPSADGLPVVVSSDGQSRTLEPIDPAGKTFSESWLRDLLFEKPSLIPISELDEPVFGPLISLAREVRTSAGPLDLLCISPSGILTVVETKLWRNPGARRNVVAQIIHYASAIAKWTYVDLVSAIPRHPGMPDATDSIIALIRKSRDFNPAGFEDAAFKRAVSRNLARGRFCLVIVGDQIHDDVTEMTDFLQTTPHLSYTCALVELAVYLMPEGGRLIQPKMVGRTREIERWTIEVRAPLKPSDIVVSAASPKGESSDRARGPRRSRITQEVFFERLRDTAGSGVAGFVQAVLPKLEELGLELEWTDVSVIYKLETDGPAAFSLGAFSATGEFRLGVTLMGACQRAGVQPEVMDRYVDGLLRLMPNAVRKPRGTGGIKLARRDGKGEPPIEWLVGKEDEFLAVVDGVIADLRRSLEPKPC